MLRRAVPCAPIAHESIRDAARIGYRARRGAVPRAIQANCVPRLRR